MCIAIRVNAKIKFIMCKHLQQTIEIIFDKSIRDFDIYTIAKGRYHFLELSIINWRFFL